MIRFKMTKPGDLNDDGSPMVLDVVARYMGHSVQVLLREDPANGKGPKIEERSARVTMHIYPVGLVNPKSKALRDLGVVARHDFEISPAAYGAVFARAAIVGQAGKDALGTSIYAWAISGLRDVEVTMDDGAKERRSFFHGGTVLE